MFEYRYVRPIIAFLGFYESVAIVTDKLPTISRMLKVLRRTRSGQFILWGLWGWFTAHIFAVAIEQMESE